MATLKFSTRSKSKEKDLVPVYCRFRSGAIDMNERTTILVNPLHWNDKKQQVNKTADAESTAIEINESLLNLKTHILNQYAKAGASVPKDWLRKTIDDLLNPDANKPDATTFFGFFRDFIDKAPTRAIKKTGRAVGGKTLNEYKKTLQYIQEFAAEKEKAFDWRDIDLDFYYEFIEYMQKDKFIVDGRVGKDKRRKVPGLSTNSIGRKIQVLKTVLNAAAARGINNYQFFRSEHFSALREESDNIFLTMDELNTLYQLNLNNQPKLERVRDLFLIGCWTGLRYSDWGQVKKENIKDGILEVKQTKTGAKVFIPVSDRVIDMIGKYGGKLPDQPGLQTFNNLLREVGKAAELNERFSKSITKGGVERTTNYKKWQMMSTHSARRSFATNEYIMGTDMLTIMAITGHKSSQSFLKYIKVNQREHAQKLLQIWKNRDAKVIQMQAG